MKNNDFITNARTNARKLSPKTEFRANTAHYPFIILLDTDDCDWKFENMRAAREFIERINGETVARKQVDVAVFKYNDEFHLLQDKICLPKYLID